MPKHRTKFRRSPKVNRKQVEVNNLLMAEADWLKAYRAKNAAAAAAFYAPEGAMLAPNQPRLSGKNALTNFIEKSFRLDNYDIVWHAKKAEVARSGELGYTSGSYEMSFRQPRGKLFFDKGKYVMVWKKQADGAWKVAFDISNSDLPPDQRR